MSTSFDTDVLTEPNEPASKSPSRSVSKHTKTSAVPTVQPAVNRRHDLDALRAIAMLMGIVLHASLSFSSIPWTVKDSQQSGFYNVLFGSIHGFRMPLFFMLSGFFTAMLWRRRGLGGLIKQRLKRIAFPLFLGCLTIVPSMWAVSYLVAQAPKSDSQNSAVWDEVVAGNTESVHRAIESDAIAVNDISRDGASLLTVAVFLGHTEMVEMLLGEGADVNQRNGDQGTALHSAAFVGRSNEAALLLKAGADPTLKDANGQTAKDLLQIDFGTTNFIATSFGNPLDEEQLRSGRADIAKQLGVQNETGSDALGATSPGWQTLKALLFQFPVFMHLWFLWFLCWLVVAFTIYAPIAKALKADKLPKWLISSPVSLLWLVPLTMVPQLWMSSSSFGPDSSIGLLPIPSVLAYYAVFFFFGALYWDADDSDGRLGRNWAFYLPIALLVVFPIGLDLVSGEFGIMPPLQDPLLNSLLSIGLQSLFAWLMIFGLIGLFRRTLSRESKTMRYISDSSYWLYLTHLPLVLLAQWFVRDFSMPMFAKFMGITFVISAFLMLTYEYGVRYTLIGRILNGPRQRPS